ncbi:MAG: hypothetical protein GY909_10600 [Oligoflexia bacterium]|nr:hypothetical protein [Oligoflexia bacterium]
MKKLYRTTSKILFSFLILMGALNAKVIGVFSDVKGNAFITQNGKTVPVKTGMHIHKQAHIYTEEGAQVSFNDYYDHIYHLSGSANIILHPNLLELREGYVWIKSLSYDPLIGPFKITTGNGLVQYYQGDYIASFDSYTGKTQLLTVKGKSTLSNILREEATVAVNEGQFSFIKNELNDGSPRRATPIGFGSFKKVTSLFKIDKKSEPVALPQKAVAKALPVPKAKVVEAPVKRSIASFDKSAFEQALQKVRRPDTPTPDGKVIFIPSKKTRKTAQKKKELTSTYSSHLESLKTKTIVKKWRPSYQQKTGVSVNIYGAGQKVKKKYRLPASKPKKTTPKAMKVLIKKSRTPASVGGMAPSIKHKSRFEHKLVEEYKNQMRHDDEVNSLIDELKSVDMDYQKEY